MARLVVDSMATLGSWHTARKKPDPALERDMTIAMASTHKRINPTIPVGGPL